MNCSWSLGLIHKVSEVVVVRETTGTNAEITKNKI